MGWFDIAELADLLLLLLLKNRRMSLLHEIA